MNNLRQILHDKNLTYQALCILVSKQRTEGMSEATLTKIIKTNYYPSEPTRKALCEALGVTESEIWPDERLR